MGRSFHAGGIPFHSNWPRRLRSGYDPINVEIDLPGDMSDTGERAKRLFLSLPKDTYAVVKYKSEKPKENEKVGGIWTHIEGVALVRRRERSLVS